ncbi:uncharacterized protein LOC106013015 [Aplysia californica]|nr:uncharacterized protein LOC106013015 [Aplysia californica]
MGNLRANGGVILAFNHTFPMFPDTPTSAVLLFFGSDGAASVWCHSLTSSEPALMSQMWALVAENKVALLPPAPGEQFQQLTVRIMKRNPGFKPTKQYSDEFQGLLRSSLRPTKKTFGARTIMSSGKTSFVCGDWSCVPASPSELTVVVIQWPSQDRSNGYSRQFDTDPALKRYWDLTCLLFSTLSFQDIPVGDIYSFLC